MKPRRVVRVELEKFSATLTGPRIVVAIKRAGVVSMPHPTRRHRTGAIQVSRDDVDDVIGALEHDRQIVEVLDRNGDPVAVGGLFAAGSG